MAAYPSSSGYPSSRPKVNPFDTVTDDDEFGDFTSATTTIPTIPSNTNGAVFFNPLPSNGFDDDEEFGEFCGPSGASVHEPVSTYEIVAESSFNADKFRPNYDIDLMDAMAVSPQLAWNRPPENHHSSIAPPAEDVRTDQTQQRSLWDDDVDEDEFSNFESAVPVIETADENEFNDFEFAQPIEQSLNSSLPVIQDMQLDKDILGSLDDQSFLPVTPADSSLPTIPTSSVIADASTFAESDEFGDFAHARPITPPSEVVLVSPVDPLTDEPSIGQCGEELFGQVETTDRVVPFSEVSTESAGINWDEPLEPLALPLSPEAIVPFVAEDLPSITVPDVEPEVQEEQQDVMNPVVDDDEDFGDFADFQTGQGEEPAAEDDEFDDFETAPPPQPDAVPAVNNTAEAQIERVLQTIFPQVTAGGPPSALLSPLKTRGPIWSYVSELDSTPALSFSWRHSTAHQHFLQSLRIDSIQPLVPGSNPTRWHNWSVSSPPSCSANSSSTTISESFVAESSPSSVAAMPLDLDFFLNPANAASSASTSAATQNSDSLLEAIEKELLSSPAKIGQKPVATQAAVPSVQHLQLSDIFGHLQLVDSPGSIPSPSRHSTEIDLLQ